MGRSKVHSPSFTSGRMVFPWDTIPINSEKKEDKIRLKIWEKLERVGFRNIRTNPTPWLVDALKKYVKLLEKRGSWLIIASNNPRYLDAIQRTLPPTYALTIGRSVNSLNTEQFKRLLLRRPGWEELVPFGFNNILKLGLITLSIDIHGVREKYPGDPETFFTAWARPQGSLVLLYHFPDIWDANAQEQLSNDIKSAFGIRTLSYFLQKAKVTYKQFDVSTSFQVVK